MRLTSLPPLPSFLGAGCVLFSDPATLEPLVRAALARWAAVAEAPPARVPLDVQTRVADLPGALLGLASDGAVWIDRDAAGHGWFIDPTPDDDAEFTASLGEDDLQAWGGTRGVDLLTVLTHEIGHVLGLEHADEGVMEPALGPGIRRLIGDPLRPALATLLPGRLSDEGLLAPEEVFPKRAQAFSFAYPLDLLIVPVVPVRRFEEFAGPRTAGSGEAVLLGGDGEDLVVGQPGKDRLIGGLGAYRVASADGFAEWFDVFMDGEEAAPDQPGG